MNHESPSNHSRIAGYLDMLLVDHSSWDEKLALATESIEQPKVLAKICPQDTVEKGRYLLVTDSFGTGTKTQKYIHLLSGISLLSSLPSSRLKATVLHHCSPLAAEAMLCD